MSKVASLKKKREQIFDEKLMEISERTLTPMERAQRFKENKEKYAREGVRKAPGRFEREIRAHISFDLKLMGYSYSYIGRLLGVKYQTVARDVKRLLDGLVEMEKEEKEKATIVEVARIEKMIEALWEEATVGVSVMGADGTPIRKVNKSAVNQIIKLQERKAKFLGLDAPERKQIGSDPENPFSTPIVTLESKTLNILQRFVGE